MGGGSPWRPRPWLLGVAVAPLLAIVLTSSATAATSYVALGDSYTAGPLIPNQTGQPSGCGRSDHNYPSLVAAAIGASPFHDISCDGAQTKHMTSAQAELSFGGTNRPQLSALEPNVELVTVGIGANDIGLEEITRSCADLGLQNPSGAPCTQKYTGGGADLLAADIADTGPKVASVIRGIQRRSPLARVLAVGYPTILPDSGPGCWPEMPIASGDLPYLRSVERKLNAMIATRAAANGAEFVDTYESSIGHDVCALPGTKWVEGLVPTSLASPVDPNSLGMENSARQVLTTVRHPVPNDFGILGAKTKPKGKIILRLLAPARGAFNGRARSYRRGKAFAKRDGKLRLKLNPRGRAKRALRNGRSLRVRVAVTFEPVGGSALTKQRRVTVR